jgi:minor histocompatibility antigen H13
MLRNEYFSRLAYLTLIALTIISRITVIPVYYLVTIHTTLLVYLGCVESLNIFNKNKPGDVQEKIETMTQKDAWMFPVIGSCTLFGLYVVFKIFHKDYVNLLFHFYFTIIGTYSVKAIIYEKLIRISLFYNLSKTHIMTVPKIPYLNEGPVEINQLDIVSYLLASIVGIAYFITKNWTLNNIFGICFSIFGIANILLGQFKVGFILLGLLFFYDIFWVFGTDVMVTVAKSLDGPIKLMFPKAEGYGTTITDFSIIGLGDIVIPGVFVALMIRYDFIKYIEKNQTHTEVDFSFKNFNFFLTTMFGYFLGIVTTLVIMNVFNHAQPALLYLVPGCLFSSLLNALLRGQLTTLWNFDEEVEMKNMKEKETPKTK